MVVYEPALDNEYFFHSKVIKDLEEFKQIFGVIVANRLSEDLLDVENLVYTQDISNSLYEKKK